MKFALVLTAILVRIVASVAGNALASRHVVGRVTESVDSADEVVARIFARLRSQVAVAVVRTFGVTLALWFLGADAFASRRKLVAVFDRTDAATAFVDDHSAF
jgi:hypothetical protein